MASRTAVKCSSAPAGSAESWKAWPSQMCPMHHASLPAVARATAARSSGTWPASRPRTCHHHASAAASRGATEASCSKAQSSTWRVVASSASSHRPAAACWVAASHSAMACSATSRVYPASAAAVLSYSQAPVSRSLP